MTEAGASLLNLGYPVNTYKNENSTVVSADGVFAYFASDREGGYGGLDIYSFELAEDEGHDEEDALVARAAEQQRMSTGERTGHDMRAAAQSRLHGLREILVGTPPAAPTARPRSRRPGPAAAAPSPKRTPHTRPFSTMRPWTGV